MSAERLAELLGHMAQSGKLAISWRSMKGMRNRIAHGYFNTDLHVVWETVQTSVPDLVQQLAGIKPA